eukprot:scaffold4860_cov171-Amphora_coffeaeformis.AAC.6
MLDEEEEEKVRRWQRQGRKAPTRRRLHHSLRVVLVPAIFRWGEITTEQRTIVSMYVVPTKHHWHERRIHRRRYSTEKTRANGKMKILIWLLQSVGVGSDDGIKREGSGWWSPAKRSRQSRCG